MIASGLIDVTPGFGENVGSVFQKGPNFNSIRSPRIGILFRGDLEDQTPLPILPDFGELLFDQSGIGTDIDGRFKRLVRGKGGQFTTGEIDQIFWYRPFSPRLCGRPPPSRPAGDDRRRSNASSCGSRR